MIVRFTGGLRPLWTFAAGLGLVAVLGTVACRSAAPPVLSPSDMKAGVASLSRPFPGDLAALYQLTVPSSGGLRLSIVTHGEAGRLTISEPFGSALSVAAWGPTTEVLDLRHGCRLDGSGRRDLFWEGHMPLAELARLLGGRLPAAAGDRIEIEPGGGVIVRGTGWSCRVTVARDPWRVTRVNGPAGTVPPSWRIRLGRHTSSLPGFLHAEWGHGKWAELKLVRLEWNTGEELPPLPDLPPCSGRE
ncbi:MAG: hypothetical protein GXP48_08525 [Acidobacteria bacterium]|nr:hypothetical protein [Acidobacteriota bacterium]